MKKLILLMKLLAKVSFPIVFLLLFFIPSVRADISYQPPSWQITNTMTGITKYLTVEYEEKEENRVYEFHVTNNTPLPAPYTLKDLEEIAVINKTAGFIMTPKHYIKPKDELRFQVIFPQGFQSGESFQIGSDSITVFATGLIYRVMADNNGMGNCTGGRDFNFTDIYVADKTTNFTLSAIRKITGSSTYSLTNAVKPADNISIPVFVNISNYTLKTLDVSHTGVCSSNVTPEVCGNAFDKNLDTQWFAENIIYEINNTLPDAYRIDKITLYGNFSGLEPNISIYYNNSNGWVFVANATMPMDTPSWVNLSTPNFITFVSNKLMMNGTGNISVYEWEIYGELYNNSYCQITGTIWNGSVNFAENITFNGNGTYQTSNYFKSVISNGVRCVRSWNDTFFVSIFQRQIGKVWGVSSIPMRKSYKFDANINITRNASGFPTCFSDRDVDILFTVAASDFGSWDFNLGMWTPETSFTCGILGDPVSIITNKACKFGTNIANTNYMMGVRFELTSTTSTANFSLFGGLISGGSGQAGIATNHFSKLYNVIFESSDIIHRAGTLADYQNLKMYGMGGTALSLVAGTMGNIEIYNYSTVFGGGAWTASNIKSRNITGTVISRTSSGDGTFLNWDYDRLNISRSFGSTDKEYIKYELDLKLIDSNQNPISDATVWINYSTKTSEKCPKLYNTTDGNGNTMTQQVTRLYLNCTGVNCYTAPLKHNTWNCNPYVFTISKPGYETLNFTANITEKTKWTLYLEKDKNSTVSWWKFENNVLDSRDANHGTMFNFTSGSWVSGKYGSGLQFNSTNQTYVDIGNSTNLNFGTGDFSVMTWIKYVNTPASSEIITKHDVGWTTWWYIEVNNDNIHFDSMTLTDDASITKIGSYNDNQWHHIVVTRGSGTGILYVDGVEAGSDSTYAGNPDSIGNLIIGGSPYNDMGYFFNGTLDDVRLFNYVLSADEVEMYYNFTYGSPHIKQWVNVSSYNNTHIVYNLSVWVLNGYTTMQAFEIGVDNSWGDNYTISLGANETNTSVFSRIFVRPNYPSQSEETITISTPVVNNTWFGNGVQIINPFDPPSKTCSFYPEEWRCLGASELGRGCFWYNGIGCQFPPTGRVQAQEGESCLFLRCEHNLVCNPYKICTKPEKLVEIPVFEIPESVEDVITEPTKFWWIWFTIPPFVVVPLVYYKRRELKKKRLAKKITTR